MKNGLGRGEPTGTRRPHRDSERTLRAEFSRFQRSWVVMIFTILAILSSIPTLSMHTISLRQVEFNPFPL